MSFLLSEMIESAAGLQPLPASQRQRYEHLNLTVAVASLLLAVMGIGGGFVWHQFQIRRNASLLLDQADKLEEREKWREAAELCFRYLKLRPDDARGWVRLATAFDRAAETKAERTRAVELYFQTIALAKDDPALRRRLAVLLFELERYAVAEYQADQLLELLPEDPAGWRIKAQASHAQARLFGRIPLLSVAKSYRKAVETNPEEVVLAVRLADLYRQSLQAPSQAERNSLADAVMNRMIEANPQVADAWLSRYEYRRRYQLAEADPDLDRALDLAPDRVEVLLAAGQREIDRRAFAQAVVHYRRVVELLPGDRRGYLGLGRALSAAGRREEAVAAWREGLTEVNGGDVVLKLKLAEMLILLGRLDEAQQTLTALDDAIAARAKTLSQRQKLFLHDAVDFVRARWWVAHGDFSRALPVLKRVLATRESVRETAEDTAQQIEIIYQVAACYAGRQQPDLAAATYEQAVSLDPNRPEHLLAAGESWEAAGHVDLAVTRYEQAVVCEGCPVAAYVLTARAHLSRERALPPSQRNWQGLERALEAAREAKVRSSLLDLIEADYLAIEGRTERAIEVLNLAAQEDGAEPRLVQGLIMAYEKWGRRDEADQALADYERQHGRTLDTLLLRSAVASHRLEWSQARAAVEEALSLADRERQPGLIYQLAMLELRDQRPDEARTRLRGLAAENPQNVGLVEVQAELALEERDWAELGRLEEQLAALEGETGTRWRYYRGRRLLVERLGDGQAAPEASDPVLIEVSQLAERIEQERATWGPGWMLRGQVEELRGQTSEAIAAYESALRYGFENILVYQRLIGLLYRQGRIAEADRSLARLSDLTVYVPQLSALAISVSTGQGQLDRALQLATQGVAERPSDPWSHIWLGQTYLLANRLDEAEAEYRQAIELAPGKIEPWLALIGFLIRSGKYDPANEAMQQFFAAVEVGPADRAFFAAQIWELTQDAERAEAEYRRALELSPDDTAILERSSRFLLARDPEAARKAMRRMLELRPDAGAARAELAVNLGEQGGAGNWKEAFELLDNAEKQPGQANPDELRALARLLVEHGGVAEHRRAIRVLEELLRSDTEIRGEDRLLLARLFETEGRVPRARQELSALVTVPEPNPDHLAAFVEFLLRNDYTNDATSWITQLRSLEPESFRALGLYARWLKAQDRTVEVADLVEDFLEKRLAQLTTPAQQAPAVLAAADIYAAVGLAELAERWYRRHAELTPEGYLPWAVWLAAQGRTAEALELFPRDSAQLSSTAAVRLAEVLVLGRAGTAERKAVDLRLAAALESHPRDVALHLAVANAQYTAGQYDRAIALYRRALELVPDNPAAMNNLALALAEGDETLPEAQAVIEGALRAAGRQLLLQDTLALILFRQGRTGEAKKILEELTSLSVAPASSYFHLALVHEREGGRDAARKSLEEAYRRGLEQAPLTPGEQRSLEYLEKALNDVAVN